MFDPAAMGTLLIGLAAAGSEDHNRQSRRAPAAARPASLRARLALARALRGIASVLEGPAVRRDRPVGAP